ncbi:MAG: hypothetical protein JSU09_10120 [Bacteroidetes bacterium]|nr:hypothetical protein [Bacteroidota bacterium]
MKEFRLSREEWYSQRDDRTLRVEGVKGFDNFSIGIVIDPSESEQYSVQATALVCVNTLSRWCKSICIHPIQQESVLPNSVGLDFGKVLLDTMISSDPYGNFQLKQFSNTDVDLIIYVGGTTVSHPWSIIVKGSGWLAGIGSKPLQSVPDDNTNPVGPSFAACLASAYAFNAAISKAYPDVDTRWYSLLDFTVNDSPNQNNPPINSNYHFGKILQVGCGAVGSSLDYLISLMKLNADLSIADFDCVEPPNCSSSLSFTANDSITTPLTKKVDACDRVLRSSGMIAKVFPDPFTASIYSTVNPDLILCLANEQAIWPAIQYNYPPLVYHATTTPNWGINFGRHIPIREWCIVCRFGITDYKFKPVCSTAVVEVEEKKILGVLPFLSPSAAIITLAEILKLSLPGYPLNQNFFQFSFKNISEAEFIGQQKERRLDCQVCSTQSFDFYPALLENSKYFYFSTY